MGKYVHMVTAAVMTAVLAVLSQIAVPLPFAGVVFSLGTFGIFLIGVILPPRYAFLSVLAYVLLGAVGVPVYAGFSAGVGVLAGPTGGFLVAYPIMAFVMSVFVNHRDKTHVFSVKTILRYAAGIVIALAVCYILGSFFYSLYAKIGFEKAFLLVGLPFIPFDILKAIMAIVVGEMVNRRQKREDRGQSRARSERTENGDLR
jgi:biotin transport system substrate-specific component